MLLTSLVGNDELEKRKLRAVMKDSRALKEVGALLGPVSSRQRSAHAEA